MGKASISSDPRSWKRQQSPSAVAVHEPSGLTRSPKNAAKEPLAAFSAAYQGSGRVSISLLKRSPIFCTASVKSGKDQLLAVAATHEAVRYLAQRLEPYASVAPSATAYNIADEFRAIASSHSVNEDPSF